MAATYTKLRDGSWGIRVLGKKPKSGNSITVRKKSGATKRETVSRVMWSGKDRTTGRPVHLCCVAQQRQSRSSRDPAYCYHPCPVSGRRCCPEKGPCHDCQ